MCERETSEKGTEMSGEVDETEQREKFYKALETGPSLGQLLTAQVGLGPDMGLCYQDPAQF